MLLPVLAAVSRAAGGAMRASGFPHLSPVRASDAQRRWSPGMKVARYNSAGLAFPGSNPGAATLRKTPSQLRKRGMEGVSPCVRTIFRAELTQGDLSRA